MNEFQNINGVIFAFAFLALLSIILKGQLYKRQAFLNEYFSLSFDVPKIVIALGVLELVLSFVVISDIEWDFAPGLLTLFLIGSMFIEMVVLEDKSFNLYSIASIWSLNIVTLSEPIGYAFFFITYGGIVFLAQRFHHSKLNLVSCILTAVIVLGAGMMWAIFGSSSSIESTFLIILIPFGLMQFANVIIRLLSIEAHNPIRIN